MEQPWPSGKGNRLEPSKPGFNTHWYPYEYQYDGGRMGIQPEILSSAGRRPSYRDRHVLLLLVHRSSEKDLVGL